MSFSFADKTLRCRECDRDFVFTVGEQEFYASRGFTNEPGRCPECRANRRIQSGEGGGRREMYPAVCAECGQQTQVPFLPRGDRPVYCSSCFDKVRSYQ
ncbi:MAG: zinc-ribbon domain containing protein [Chloroflexi bacterium]|nr:zinc-ribbon domain containing protein [Chloroflexota bacterium]